MHCTQKVRVRVLASMKAGRVAVNQSGSLWRKQCIQNGVFTFQNTLLLPICILSEVGPALIACARTLSPAIVMNNRMIFCFLFLILRPSSSFYKSRFSIHLCVLGDIHHHTRQLKKSTRTAPKTGGTSWKTLEWTGNISHPNGPFIVSKASGTPSRG